MRHYKIKAFAVIDTNVLIAAMKTKDDKSPTYLIGELIKNENIIPIYDERMLSEYYAVMNYGNLNFEYSVIDEYMNLILNKGIYIDDVKKLDIEIIDKSDIPFYEVMMESKDIGAELVTGNTKHFPEGSCVTPHQLISHMNYFETFIQPIKKIDYNNEIDNIIIKLTNSGKYYLGEKLPKEFIEHIKEKRLGYREHIDIKDYID